MYTKTTVSSRVLKGLMRMMMGVLLLGAAFMMVSPTASAHPRDVNLSWWTNSEYNMEYLVVDYFTTGVPFDMSLDEGFCFKGHCYPFYHRYFVYEGNGFHTYYYYVYRQF